MTQFMLGLGDEGMMSLGLGIALRSSLVLAVAGLLTMLLRRQSAAARHLVWSAAVAGVLALPLIPQVVPAWRVLPGESRAEAEIVEREADDLTRGTTSEVSPLMASLDSAPERTWQALVDVQANEKSLKTQGGEPSVSQVAASEKQIWQWPETRQIIGAVWLIGAMLLSLPMLLGFVSVHWLRRRARPMPDELAAQLDEIAVELRIRRHVVGVLSTERTMPMTWSWWRPVVLLPCEAESWPAERRRSVLLHELAHVRRCDCLTQCAAQWMRALHWFNPLAWWALHRVRIEQERACDDCVLNAGTRADDYAAELLSVTARLPRARWDSAVALAMSRASRIERRLAAILDEHCERQPLSARRATLLTVMLALLVVGTAAIQRKVVQAEEPSVARALLPVAEDRDRTSQPSDEPGRAEVPNLHAASAELARTDATANLSADATGETTQIAQAGAQPASDKPLALREALRQIQTHSVLIVDETALNEGAIRGMLESLKDPYSTLITAAQMKELLQQIDGKFVGIGAALAKEDGGIVITALMPNSPALLGGLKPRDVIIEVNGQPANDLAETVKVVRGPAGTEVTLKIRKPGKQETRLTLKRGEVRVPSVKGLSLDEQGQWQHWLDESQKIAFVQLAVFDRETPAELKHTLTRLHEKGLKGLVLDLRGNPGGILTSSVEVAELMLKEGTIVEVRGRQPDQSKTYSAGAGGAGQFAEVSVVVLIDSTTASAAEILAAALKDNNRAILVGERTFGKGSVQAIFPLEKDGASLKLTTAQMFLPSGRPLHRSPDAKLWGVDPQDGFFVPLTTEQRVVRLKTQLDRETGQLKLPQPITAEFAEKDLADPGLAAALKTMSAKLKTGEFTKTGRPIAELQAQLAQREELRKQRDDLRRKLEQLDRELGEVGK